jgi:hypothetical protein
MSSRKYVVPDSAPASVKSILKGAPSRTSLRLLIGLSTATALIVAWVERGHATAALGLIFIWYGILAWRALRWAEANRVFDEK